MTNMIHNRTFIKFISTVTVILMSFFQTGISYGMTINAGDTLNVESTPGSWYTYTTGGAITINGILKGREKSTPGGALTGNGARVQLNAGSIIVGSAGQINLDATAAGGNGGHLILNAPVITQDGLISANGWGTGKGGTIDITGGSFTLGPTGKIYARGGATGLGGIINIDVTGNVDIQAGSAISSNGVTSYSGGNVVQNLVTIKGAGVNIAGNVSALGTGSSNGGRIVINNANSGNVNIATAGVVKAIGGSGGAGGQIEITTAITGDVIVDGQVQVLGGAGGSGGTIDIASANDVTVANAAQITANAASGVGTTSHGGTISITGANNVSISNNVANSGTITANGANNSSGGGTGGTITINAQNGNLLLSDARIKAQSNKGANGGSVDLSAGNTLTITNNTYITANSGDGGTNAGNGGSASLTTTSGDIIVDAHSSFTTINVNAAATPASYAAGGNGGSISFTSGRDILVNADNTSSVTTLSANGSIGPNPGDGGTVSLSGRNLSVAQNIAGPKIAFINANGGNGQTTTTGNGGTVTANLTGGMTLTNASINTSAGKVATGYSGDMNGNAGTINLQMQNNFTMTTGSILSRAFGNSGNGGSITIASSNGDISILGSNNYIQNDTNGNGVVSVSGNNITNNGLIASVGATRFSSGGTVNITTSAGGTFTNNAQVSALAHFSSGNTDNTQGDGGTININAGNIVLNANSTLFALGGYDVGSGIRGNGGVININASGSLTAAADSSIDTSGTPVLSGGNYTDNRITITAASAGLNGYIFASGRLGNDPGGNINITTTAGNLTVGSTSLISAGGDRLDFGLNPGNGGKIVLNAQAGSITVNGIVEATGDLGHNGGIINATASQNININGDGQINASSTDGNGTGNGGTVTINAANLNISRINQNLSAIDVSGSTNTGGGASGNGGNISVNVTNTIAMDKSNLKATGVSAGVVNLLANNSITALNSVFSGTTRLQAGNSITATTGNVFNGVLGIYGDAGANDHVAQVDLTNTAGSNFTIDRLTATNANLSNTGAGTIFTVSNVNTNNGVVTITGSGHVTLTDSTVDGTDTYRLASSNNGNISLGSNSVNTLVGKTSLTGTETNGLYTASGTGNWILSSNSISGATDLNVAGTITGISGSYGGTLKALSSGSSIDIIASSGNITADQVSASGFVNLNATNGNIATTASSLIQSNTQVSLTAGTGSISVIDITAPVINLVADGASGSIAVNNGLFTAASGATGGQISLHSSGNITMASSTFNAHATGFASGGSVSLISTGGTVATDTINTYGQSDATHNTVTLQGQNVNVNNLILARGDSTNGGKGGTVNITSTGGGDIILNDNINVRGFAKSNARSGNAGNVTINASGDYTQNARIFANSASPTVQGLNGENEGGDVSITAGGSAIFNYGGNLMIDTAGANYGSGSNLNGGNGGNITITAQTSIDLNDTGSASAFFKTRGGTGRSNGYSGGDGGNINFNIANGNLNIDVYNKNTNFQVNGGNGVSGALDGTNGQVYLNGGILP